MSASADPDQARTNAKPLPERLDIGHGCELIFQEDTSVMTTYDGQDPEGLNVPDHWHELHDEYMTIYEGSLQISQDGVWKTYQADPDTEIAILRGTVHALKSVPGVAVKFRERTKLYGPLVNTPRFKQSFFADVFQYGSPSAFHACRAMVDHDTYVKVPGPKFISLGVTYTLANIGWLAGSRRIEDAT